MTFYDNGRDEVIAHHTIPQAYQSYPGIVHGDIIAAEAEMTLADVPTHMLANANIEALGWYIDP
jgi:hypothetical protein